MTARPAASVHQSLVLHLVAGVLAAAAIAVVAALAGWSARIELLVGVCVVAAVALLACRRLSDAVIITMWPRDGGGDGDAYVPEDRVTFLERRLQLSTKDERIFQTRIQPVLGEQIAHALAHGHGIDVDAEPRLARRLAGEPLWALATQAPGRPPTRQQLTVAIDQLERLSARD